MVCARGGWVRRMDGWRRPGGGWVVKRGVGVDQEMFEDLKSEGKERKIVDAPQGSSMTDGD